MTGEQGDFRSVIEAMRSDAARLRSVAVDFEDIDPNDLVETERESISRAGRLLSDALSVAGITLSEVRRRIREDDE